jgi:hypothetical protein
VDLLLGSSLLMAPYISGACRAPAPVIIHRAAKGIEFFPENS